MSFRSNHIALFIDGANLHATARTLGFEIDYKRLLKEFEGQGSLLCAFYYTAISEDQEYSSLRPLTDWLNYNGYTVVTKAVKEFTDASGRRSSREIWTSSLPSMPWSSPVKLTRWFCSRATDLSAPLSRQFSVAASAYGDFYDIEPPADDRGRIAASGRRLHGPRGVAIPAQPRTFRTLKRASGPRSDFVVRPDDKLPMGPKQTLTHLIEVRSIQMAYLGKSPKSVADQIVRNFD